MAFFMLQYVLNHKNKLEDSKQTQSIYLHPRDRKPGPDKTCRRDSIIKGAQA
jgi:hypothetical protein